MIVAGDLLLNKLRNDSTHPIRDLRRRVVDRGNGGATKRRLIISFIDSLD